MSYIGTSKLGGMYLGDTKIGKAYLGEDLVYSTTEDTREIVFLESVDSTTPITFNTGVDITTNHTWEIDSSANLYSAWATWSSCWDGSAWKTSNSFIVQRSNNTPNFILYIGNLNGGVQKLFSPRGERFVQGYDGTKYYCSGFTYNFSPRAYTAPLQVRSQHIYGVKIWRNGTLVNDFVPANVDGEVGMYDTKRKKFIKLL